MLILLLDKNRLTANTIGSPRLPFCIRFFVDRRKLPPARESNGSVAPAGGLPGELLPQREGLLCESILIPVEIYLFLQVASSEETPVLSNRLIV